MSDLELRNLERAVAEGTERPYKLQRARERLGLLQPTNPTWLDERLRSVAKEARDLLPERIRWARIKKELAQEIKVAFSSQENCLACAKNKRVDWSLCRECEDKKTNKIQHFARYFWIYKLRVALVAEPDLVTIGIIPEKLSKTWELAFSENWDYSLTKWADEIKSDRVQAPRNVVLEWSDLVLKI